MSLSLKIGARPAQGVDDFAVSGYRRFFGLFRRRFQKRRRHRLRHLATVL
jgi:hypothetical protein